MDLYGMSDEDFLNADADTVMKETPTESSAVSEEESLENEPDLSVDSEDNGSKENLDEHVEDSEEEFQEEDEEQDDSESIDTDDSEPEEQDEPVEDADEDSESDGEESDEDEPTDEQDFEAMYKELLAPVKANGRMEEITSVDEARRLMSMGIDYGRKMHELKGQRKLLKMLDNHDLLDEDKLSFLIDIEKKNPEAIAKLVQDSGIDPLDLNQEEDNKYTPSDHKVTDAQVELDDVVESIRSTPTYADTMAIASKLDEASKRILAKNPQTLVVLNEHKANGIYDKVQARVDRERMFGQLSGLSDLEAYNKVGDIMYQEGAFNDADLVAPNKPKAKVVKTAPANKPADKDLTDKKRKASPTKSSKAKKRKPEYDFWNMSDEDFEKVKL